MTGPGAGAVVLSASMELMMSDGAGPPEQAERTMAAIRPKQGRRSMHHYIYVIGH